MIDFPCKVLALLTFYKIFLTVLEMLHKCESSDYRYWWEIIKQ